jgi:hypothetical protein
MSVTEVPFIVSKSSFDLFSPYRLPLFDATERELELFMLFALFAVRTNADVATSSLKKLMGSIDDGPLINRRPYADLRELIEDNVEGEDSPKRDRKKVLLLEEILKESGCRFYKMKARGVYHQLYELRTGDRLRGVTRQQMLEWPGVGWKTSSFFVLHTQMQPPNPVACLDVHILRYLKRKIGHKMEIPDVPPNSAAEYIKLESEFLKLARKAGIHPAYFDVGIWAEERLKK